MKATNIIFIIFCLIFAFLFRANNATAVGFDLKLQAGSMSADINGISIRAVFEKIFELSGIKVKCDNSLYEKKIYAKFYGLPIQEGFKRLLVSMNYSLLFDKAGEVEEVIIISGKSFIRDKIENPGVYNEKNKNMPDVSGDFPGGPVKITPKEAEGMMPDASGGIPGGPVKITPKEAEGMMPDTSGGIPGGPVKITPKEAEGMMPDTSGDIPGGPVK